MRDFTSPPPLAAGGSGEGALPRTNCPLPPSPSHRGRGGFLGSSLVVLMLAAGFAAQAQPAPNWKQMTSKQLATACHASDPAQRGTCLGYVTGVYDLQFAPTPPR